MQIGSSSQVQRVVGPQASQRAEAPVPMDGVTLSPQAQALTRPCPQEPAPSGWGRTIARGVGAGVGALAGGFLGLATLGPIGMFAGAAGGAGGGYGWGDRIGRWLGY